MREKAHNTKKFLYYVPYLYFDHIHNNRPMVEIPISAKMMGYESILLIGRKATKEQIGIRVIETGIYSHNQNDRNLSGVLREAWRAYMNFRNLLPEYAVFHGNYAPSLIVAILTRATHIFFRKYNRPKIALKLDWDGDLKYFKILSRIFYTAFILASSFHLHMVSEENKPC